MNATNLEPEVFDLIDGVENLSTTVDKLGAVMTVFAEKFTQHPAGVNVKAIEVCPAIFRDLFSVLVDYIHSIDTQTASLDALAEEYLAAKRSCGNA